MATGHIFLKARQNRIFQDVVDQIQQAILDGKLKPGDTLPPERELRDVFNISRGTLREALRILEHKGLIEIRLGVRGGAVISDGTRRQAKESLALMIRSQKVSLFHLAEFRNGVESSVACLAANRAKKPDIDRLKQLLAQAKTCIEGKQPKKDAFIDMDRQIHETLADIAGNPVYIFILQAIHENIHEYYNRFLEMDIKEMMENYDDLCNIIAAVENGDTEKAGELSQNHVSKFHNHMENQKKQNTAI